MGYIPPHKENIIWIKIDNDPFDVVDVTVQLSIGSHTTTYISLDINKNPNYLKYFTNLYENHSSFTMSSIKFVAPGSLIKSIDGCTEVSISSLVGTIQSQPNLVSIY